MKGSVDIFQTMIAAAIVAVGFVIVIMFIGEVTVFNAEVTKPSIETVQLIDKTHQVENCLNEPSVNELQTKLKECKLDSEYVELSDLSGKVWKEGQKSEGQREHTIWINIKNGGAVEMARLYVKV